MSDEAVLVKGEKRRAPEVPVEPEETEHEMPGRPTPYTSSRQVYPTSLTSHTPTHARTTPPVAYTRGEATPPTPTSSRHTAGADDEVTTGKKSRGEEHPRHSEQHGIAGTEHWNMGTPHRSRDVSPLSATTSQGWCVEGGQQADKTPQRGQWQERQPDPKQIYEKLERHSDATREEQHEQDIQTMQKEVTHLQEQLFRTELKAESDVNEECYQARVAMDIQKTNSRDQLRTEESVMESTKSAFDRSEYAEHGAQDDVKRLKAEHTSEKEKVNKWWRSELQAKAEVRMYQEEARDSQEKIIGQDAEHARKTKLMDDSARAAEERCQQLQEDVRTLSKKEKANRNGDGNLDSLRACENKLDKKTAEAINLQEINDALGAENNDRVERVKQKAQEKLDTVLAELRVVRTEATNLKTLNESSNDRASQAADAYDVAKGELDRAKARIDDQAQQVREGQEKALREATEKREASSSAIAAERNLEIEKNRCKDLKDRLAKIDTDLTQCQRKEREHQQQVKDAEGQADQSTRELRSQLADESNKHQTEVSRIKADHERQIAESRHATGREKYNAQTSREQATANENTCKALTEQMRAVLKVEQEKLPTGSASAVAMKAAQDAQESAAANHAALCKTEIMATKQIGEAMDNVLKWKSQAQTELRLAQRTQSEHETMRIVYQRETQTEITRLEQNHKESEFRAVEEESRKAHTVYQDTLTRETRRIRESAAVKMETQALQESKESRESITTQCAKEVEEAKESAEKIYKDKLANVEDDWNKALDERQRRIDELREKVKVAENLADLTQLELLDNKKQIKRVTEETDDNISKHHKEWTAF